MLYRLLKIPAVIASWIFCRHIYLNNKKLLSSRGPLLIAANHPNSFLDAIILAILFKRPVYSLVRGDVYKNKFYASLLTSLNMLPVFRMSEGSENLDQNYSTFDKCKKIFKKNGIVLIFSEGACINEWRLRPLKKGTARLAISSWQDGIDLKVLPAGINYQSFTSFGKNIQLNFGKIILKKNMVSTNGYGNTINVFNELLKKELKELVIETDSHDKKTIRKNLEVKQNKIKKILLLLPALLGYSFHVLLYVPVHRFTWRKANHNDHYDSIMVGLLFILYPFYLLLVALFVHWLVSGFWWISVFFILPFCARSFVQLKTQF